VLFLVGAASAGLSGCALPRLADRELTTALQRYERGRYQSAERFAGLPGTGVPATRPAETPETQPLDRAAAPRSLRDYILHALRENPEIKAAEQTAWAKAARVPQVTALPDPVLSTKTLPEPVRTAEGDNFFILGIRQKFPVPEKLDRAGRIALEEMRMALEKLQQTRLRVIGDVKRAYYRLYIIDRTTEITRANQDLLRGLIDVARGQVAVGKRSQDDVLRAQVELSILESQLIELDQRHTATIAALNRVLNRDPRTPVEPPAKFDAHTADVRLEELFKLAVESNPELRRLEKRIERDREALKLSRLAYWPDFTLGLDWMPMEPRSAFRPPPNPQTGMRPPTPTLSETGSDNWAITFSLNLPVWFEKIRGGIRESRHRLTASQHDFVSARNRVYFQIDDALTRVQAQRELAELFLTTIIPQAQQAYEVSRASYTAGTTDFLFVIDNWQKWLVFTIQYHRALGELERSVADLEQALGLSLSELEDG
jgi:outer membrane protein TolC